MQQDSTTVPSSPVLIVEDDAPLREIMQVLLENATREVRFAECGRQALAAIGAHDPNPVVIDLGLPDMHGFELAREIRAQESGTPRRLIAFTGYDGEDHRREAQAAGFDEFIVKPMDLDTMEQVFARILAP